MIEPFFVAHGTRGSRALRTLKEGPQRRCNPRDALGSRDPTVVYADSDRGQPEADCRDAAGRVGCAAVRNEAIGWIRLVPKVIEIGFLSIIKELVVARKRIGDDSQGRRPRAFIRGPSHGGDLVKVRLAVADPQIAETPGR